MANLIKLKRSAVEGAIPTTVQLDLGELAINTYDGKLYLKRNDGLQDYIVEVGGNVGFEVKNQTGSTIPKGTVVKFTGTLGASGKLLAAPFIADNTDPSEYVMGITENDIVNGGDGFVIDHGKIFELNTSAFSQGAILYASSTVSGGLTDVRPEAPNNKVIVGAVIHSGTSNGILEVRVTPGSNIGNDELVELGTLADGDTLIWNAAAGRFENDAAITGLQTALDGKQASLVSGTNIKTVNGNTLLGSGDLVISGGGGGALNDLSDVAITTPTEGDVLYYDGATWINDASVASSLVTINTALAPLARQTTTTEIKAISVGTTAPSTPNTGDLWVDTN